ncbi:MAG: leucine-rich repeat domain-containing protein [Treponema sp.]|nr:leucine-rich repeat domain-containing protein [Treponema sp.]
MKTNVGPKIIATALVAAVLALGLASCQGLVGPMGAQGPSGESGTPGGSDAPLATMTEIMEMLSPSFIAAMEANPANDGLTADRAFTFRPAGFSLANEEAMKAVYALIQGYWVDLDLSDMTGNSFVVFLTPTGDKSKIRSVTLGQNVSMIMDRRGDWHGAFGDFSNLQSFTGNGVVVVGDYAFDGASSLTDINLPQARIIGAGAFEWTRIVEANLPEARVIRDGAFREATSLTDIYLPQAISIGHEAFYRTSISEVDLPLARVIGDRAFLDAASLTDISLPRATDIGAEAFRGTKIELASLPEARVIGDRAFLNVVSLTNISLPRATDIGAEAFRGTKIELASLPEARVIGDAAFLNVVSLTDISLPRATDIGDEAFRGTKIAQVSLLEARVIGDRAFYPAGNTHNERGANAVVTTVDLPRVTSIGAEAFRYARLTTLRLPQVREIGASAFRDNASLESLNIPLVEQIHEDAFRDNSSLTSPGSLNNLRVIGDLAFAYTRLIGVVVGGVGQLYLTNATSIGHRAFYGAEFDYVSLPRVTIIHESAFQNNANLTIVDIGPDIAVINGSAFANCGMLNHVKINRSSPPILSGTGHFAGAHVAFNVRVPAAALVLYEAQWSAAGYTGAFEVLQ